MFGGLVEYSAWGPVNLVSVAEPDPAELSPEPLDVSADNNTVAFSGVGVEISTDTLSGAGVKSDGIFGGCVRISEIYPGINVSADTNTVALSHVSASGARVYGGLIESGFAYPYPVSTSGSSDSALSSVSLSASGNSVFLEQSSAGDVYGGTIRTGGRPMRIRVFSAALRPLNSLSYHLLRFSLPMPMAIRWALLTVQP